MDYPVRWGRIQPPVRRRVQHQPLHRLPDLHDGLQVHLDPLTGPGADVVEQRRDQALRRIPATHWDVKTRWGCSTRPIRVARRGIRPSERCSPSAPYGRFEVSRPSSRPPTASSETCVPATCPAEDEWKAPNRFEDHATPQSRSRRRLACRSTVRLVLLPRPHLQPLHVPRLVWPPAPATPSTSGPRTASCWLTRSGAGVIANACRGLPLQEGHLPAYYPHHREVHRLLSPGGR